MKNNYDFQNRKFSEKMALFYIVANLFTSDLIEDSWILLLASEFNLL